MIIKSSDLTIIIQYIIYFAVYFISGSLSCYLQALYTWFLGDKTAVRAGYLTLNPLTVVDWLGFLSFLIFGLGWQNSVPINPSTIQGRYRGLRMALVYLVMPFVHGFLALISLLLLALMYPIPVDMLLRVLHSGMHPHEEMFAGDFSGLTLIITLLLSGILYYNSIMVFVGILRNFYQATLEHGIRKVSKKTPYLEYLFSLGPLLTVLLVARPLIGYILYLDSQLFFRFVGLGGT